MNKTTVAHLIVERLAREGIKLEFPKEYKGDISLEHDWVFVLMKRYPNQFREVCEEVDEMIKEGLCQFTDDGIIIYH